MIDAYLAARVIAWPMSGQFQIETIAADAGTKSCRRPLKVGRYDATSETTFVSWLGADCAAFVAGYDHPTRSWSEPKRVGTSYEDYHNYPHLVQTADGRLHVFHGCHNTPLRHAVAPSPHTLEGEWDDQAVDEAPAATYPMPFVTTDGKLFVFYRQTIETDERPISYLRSTDHGQTWTHSSSLTERPFALGHRDREDNMNEIYIGQMRQATPDERVGIAWTLAGGGPDGHEHDRYHRNVYYAEFDPGELQFYAADGTQLGSQLDRIDSETECKVIDTGHPDGLDVDYIQYIHATTEGDPLMIVGTTEGYQCARWGANGWDVGPMSERTDTGFPGNVYDIERTGPTSFQLYASHADGMQVFTTDDGGEHWRGSEVIKVGRSIRHAVVIDQYRDPIRLLATEASDWSSYALDRDIFAVGRSSSSQ